MPSLLCYSLFRNLGLETERLRTVHQFDFDVFFIYPGLCRLGYIRYDIRDDNLFIARGFGIYPYRGQYDLFVFCRGVPLIILFPFHDFQNVIAYIPEIVCAGRFVQLGIECIGIVGQLFALEKFILFRFPDEQ